MAHSDATKRLLAARGAGPLLMKLAAAYHGDKDIAEPAVGLMANMTLRQPEVVHLCAEVGVIDWILELMAAMPASRGVQRSGCILVRNMVVRTTEHRDAFLDKGAEALLRAAKQRHPKYCNDVGSAALRDLGLDHYGTMEEFCVGNAAEDEYDD
ncbi:uncharacterized protein HaLaN_30200 [Haematococcus lacustris]|uniref:Uncharacterized protein n=1 Tax=Haematococcus lacustris TaxID=44745 RepID=A0A6A0AE86_HAELA|nr:uncharacterized protein HaLaN_30200 [Haematococcus lacustris]